jgi:crotonobetainyl-CoA hydratase
MATRWVADLRWCWCDIVIAAQEAGFGLPEPRVGRLPLDGGMVPAGTTDPASLCHGHAAHRATDQAAAQAMEWGWSTRVPRVELDAAVDRWLADILACAPLSLRAIKTDGHAEPRSLVATEAQALRLPALIECLQLADGEEAAILREAHTGLDRR